MFLLMRGEKNWLYDLQRWDEQALFGTVLLSRFQFPKDNLVPRGRQVFIGALTPSLRLGFGCVSDCKPDAEFQKLLVLFQIGHPQQTFHSAFPEATLGTEKFPCPHFTYMPLTTQPALQRWRQAKAIELLTLCSVCATTAL